MSCVNSVQGDEIHYITHTSALTYWFIAARRENGGILQTWGPPTGRGCSLHTFLRPVPRNIGPGCSQEVTPQITRNRGHLFSAIASESFEAGHAAVTV